METIIYQKNAGYFDRRFSIISCYRKLDEVLLVSVFSCSLDPKDSIIF